MKITKTKFMVVSILIALSLCASWTIVGFTQTKIENTNLSFQGKTNQESFILGEPVAVEFEILNGGESSVPIDRDGVESGIQRIFVANQNGEYKQYFGYGWGLLMGSPLSLAPGESYKYKEIRMLYQGKIETEGLSEKAARSKLQGKITTEYAFPEPGVYFIKAVNYTGKSGTLMESKPIKVVIKEPIGDDLEVWNQIKGNQEIALLMQSGEFKTDKEAEKEQLSSQIEQIVEKYPNSTYSGYLKPNLEKYKAHQKVIKDSLEKARIKPSN